MTVSQYNDCVKNHSDDVYRFVLKNIIDKDSARDMVQIAFEVMWTKREEVEANKAKSFLFTVAYRKVIDDIRNQRKLTLTEEIPEHLGGQTEQVREDLKVRLHKALNQLPQPQKQLVLLKDYEGCSYDDLAQITGLNSAQVKVYLHRARNQLKKALVSVEIHL